MTPRLGIFFFFVFLVVWEGLESMTFSWSKTKRDQTKNHYKEESYIVDVYPKLAPEVIIIT